MIKTLFSTIIFTMFIAFTVLTVPAQAQGYEAQTEDGDPWETMNRGIFSFNKVVDTVLLKPVAQGYDFIFPDIFKGWVHNALNNLKSPVVAANELLQGDLDGAATVGKRFVVNSTIGLAGALDIAGHHGLPAEPEEDFGQTLAVWGVPAGPYIMLPIIGPSNVRDVAGRVVDAVADPFNMLARAKDEPGIIIGRGVATAIDTRYQNLGLFDDLEGSTNDMYSALRSIYEQRRATVINDGAVDLDIPDFDSIEPAAGYEDAATSYETEALELDSNLNNDTYDTWELNS